MGIFGNTSKYFLDLVTARQRSCGKVMFSVLRVCLSRGGDGAPHVTITHDALDLTVKT